ncbi:hypothetical protein KXR53_15225 [Inquilinus limosus]|uniref:hypothetical protein n=1 Tax=Inquilinus limosus TaxID=171674 RepID=UPI003F1577C7
MLMRNVAVTMFGLVLAGAALPAGAQAPSPGKGAASSECSTQQGCASVPIVRKSGGANGLGLRGNGTGVSALQSTGRSVWTGGGANGFGLRGNGTGVSALQSSGKPVWTGGGANGFGLRGNGTGHTATDSAE